jgi:hypothetical protein
MQTTARGSLRTENSHQVSCAPSRSGGGGSRPAAQSAARPSGTSSVKKPSAPVARQAAISALSLRVQNNTRFPWLCARSTNLLIPHIPVSCVHNVASITAKLSIGHGTKITVSEYERFLLHESAAGLNDIFLLFRMFATFRVQGSGFRVSGSGNKSIAP